MVAEDSQEVDLTVLLDTDLVIQLNLVTILVTIVLLTIISVIVDSLTTTGTTISFTITTGSSSDSISRRLDFLIGGAPTTTILIRVRATQG